MKIIIKYLKVMYPIIINLITTYFTYIGLLTILSLLYSPKQVIINFAVFKNSFWIFLPLYTIVRLMLYINNYQGHITNYLIILIRKLKRVISRNN